MQPRRHVLLSTTAGAGQPAGDARLVALVALLRRRARTPLVAVAPDATRARGLHSDLTCIDDADFAAGLEGAELLCIAGALDDGRDLERAARHAAAARLRGVPVAVVAAAFGPEAAAAAPIEWSEILSQCESVSASDADSARRLAAWRGRRVETVAPSELVLEPDAGAAADRRGCIGIDIGLADGLDASAFEALRVALRAYGPRLVVLLGESRRSALVSDAVRIETVTPAWPAWRRAVSRCEVVLCADAGGIAATVLALGAVPVVAAPSTPLHARIALGDCTVGALQDPGAWARALAAAACAGRTIGARVAPLRALAWRALGPLADAARAAALPLDAASAPARALWATACASLAAPALAAGDGAAAERVLDACGDTLATEPAWAEARARADALLGRDADAVARLERAANALPQDARAQAALARALSRRGDAEAATTVWQRCAALQPCAAEPCWEMAQLALVAGRLADALAALADALAREPEHAPSARTVRALLVSEPQREVEFWRALCARHADVAALWHQHALAAGRTGAWADALSCAARALALAPRDPEIIAAHRHVADRAALHGGAAPADESAAVAGGPHPGV